jgi:hypothetical protein
MAARLTVCLALLALLLTGCGAACGPGQTCVPDAGVSVVLPAGWSGKGSANEPLRWTSARIILQRGDAILEAGLRTLEEVEAAVAARFSSRPYGYPDYIDESLRDRVTLPIGPAVRDRLRGSAMGTFGGSFPFSSTVYWFFVDGQLVELEYREAWGGGGDAALPPETEPAELRSILDSLHRMTPEMQAATWAASVLPWLVAGGLGLLVVGTTAGVMAVPTLRRRLLVRSSYLATVRRRHPSLAPFILGLAAPMVGWLAYESSPLPHQTGDLLGFLVGALTIFLVPLVAAGAVAGAVSGRGHGWLGFGCAMAGASVMCAVAVAVASSDATIAIKMTIYGSVPMWIGLAIGYAPAHWIAGRSDTPTRPADDPPVIPAP